MQSHLAPFAKNNFPTIFGGYLKFLHKNAKMNLSWKWWKIEILVKFLPRRDAQSHLPIFEKSIFLSFFAASLSCCINGKSD